MRTQMLNSPALQHPGAAGAPDGSKGSMTFDDTWLSLVDQRMAVRLDEADEDRLARLAVPARPGFPLRARVGTMLIAFGAVVAGVSVETGAAGRTA